MRRAEGLSAMKLAVRANLSQALIYAIETGAVQSPTVETRLKIAAALNVRPSVIWPELAA